MLFPVSAENPLLENMMIKSTLPVSVQNISQIIGLTAALALVNKFGGTEIRMPAMGQGSSSGHYQGLVEAIGHEATCKLAENYSGDEIYIPNCTTTRRILRDIEIVRAFDALTPDISSRKAISKLASEYHLSSRMVEKIVNRPTLDNE